MAHTSTLHPAYLAAPESARWRGELDKLWEALNHEAPLVRPKWSFFVMPRGARVALRVNDDNSRELVIYRREPFTTKEGSLKWTIELLTFRREFKIEHWTTDHSETKEGGPVCTFRERTLVLDFFNAEDPE